MTLQRKDHRPAIVKFLKQRPARLHQIVSHLRAIDSFRAVDYDVRRLRMAGTIRTVKGLWEITK